jgi:hypothetical protein
MEGLRTKSVATSLSLIHVSIQGSGSVRLTKAQVQSRGVCIVTVEVRRDPEKGQGLETRTRNKYQLGSFGKNLIDGGYWW